MPSTDSLPDPTPVPATNSSDAPVQPAPDSVDASPDADASASAVAHPAADTAAPETTASAPRMTPADCGQRLKQLWPALFAGAAKPIKLRIQKDIQERNPGGFTRAALSGFLHRHTGSTSYLLAIAKGGPRFDLDGNADGEISEEHRKVAAEELARRRANRAAREELELQQRHNRAALLRDFERTSLSRANFCALKGVAEDELDGLLALARDEAIRAPAPARERPPRDDPRARRPRR